ncbi:MAG: serine hydrolase [Clostridia bacterium]|nr:serine hydrolase [Clostridia bacterium]
MNKELQVLESIKKEMAPLTGHLGLYYKNLATGFEYGVGEDEVYVAASVIKLPLFLHPLAECEKGKLSLDDRIVTEESDKVPSCGALNMFTGTVETDIRTLCRLMICISDNTATNRLLRYFGLEDVERGFIAMGLEKTKIRRFLFDHRESLRGVQNHICPKELGMILEKLYRGEFVNEEISKYAIDVLLEQQINHKLDGKINEEVPIAHKTGEDYMLSNDVGIVYAKNPFVICFAGHDTDVYLWEDLIRRAAYDLYKAQE